MPQGRPPREARPFARGVSLDLHHGRWERIGKSGVLDDSSSERLGDLVTLRVSTLVPGRSLSGCQGGFAGRPRARGAAESWPGLPMASAKDFPISLADEQRSPDTNSVASLGLRPLSGFNSSLRPCMLCITGGDRNDFSKGHVQIFAISLDWQE